MTKRTVVVDYGIGNVFSVCNALTRIGEQPELTGDLKAIRDADRVILPGVGAFARAMDALNAKGLAPVLRDYVATGRPFLGICIGMQVLMDRSTEFGVYKGLGFVSGSVERIPDRSPLGDRLRVPHIGWATLKPSTTAGSEWKGTLLSQVAPNASAVYFVHSYHCMPADIGHRLAIADYGGVEITAAIRKDNVVGVQFHPERSGEVGQEILRSFLSIN